MNHILHVMFSFEIFIEDDEHISGDYVVMNFTETETLVVVFSSLF